VTDQPESMYFYYEQQNVLPTYGAFGSPGDLEAHERHRRRLFTDKLSLPPRVFAGTRLLEFGPDAGENSLVFAGWGADCTLAEPHLAAHPVIREYFERYGLGDRLTALSADDVVGYPLPAEQFDVVDAEGFIYTIQPSSLWIEKLGQLLREEGLAVLFYMTTSGSLFELVWKVVQARFRALTGLDSVASARTLFAAKWASIPHKRSIESWTMDVLENPFVRLQYCIDPALLCAEMDAAGFRLYSSWPRYDGGLDVHWFKRDLTAGEQLGQELDFIARSELSHMFGRKHFLVAHEPTLGPRLHSLREGLDTLIDGFDEDVAAACDDHLGAVTSILESASVLSSPEDRELSRATLETLRRLLALLATGSPDEIERFCNDDPAFIATWGTPSHFAVFRKTAE
jgi:hypothetical protein